MNHHSFGSISDYLDCPHKLRCRREKVASTLQEIGQAGKVLHAFFEFYVRACLGAGAQTRLSLVPNLFEDAWNSCRHEAAEKGETFLSPRQRENLFEAAKAFADTHLIDVDAVAAVEDRLAVDASMRPVEWFDRSAWFRGVLDLLEFPEPTFARITDYKSGWKIEVDPLQMRVYAWLVFSLYPKVMRVECVLDYTRFNVQRSQEFNRDDHAGLDGEIRGLIARIDADTELLPTPGAACASCPYAGACTAAVVPLRRIGSDEDARREVENAAILERDLAAVKARIREWCELNGPVDHNGLVWGHHAQGGLGFKSAEAFLAATEQDGIERKLAMACLSVSGTKVKKLKDKKTGEFPPALQAAAVNKRSVKFGAKKSSGAVADETEQADGEEDAA
ncbi:MAG: PD-(D/E)XK nuclease family protein [FCB group bacterium]|jgi:hypothetical protein|nr:PD-(D/E)XK nuclease family protein [FCB group bacterium]